MLSVSIRVEGSTRSGEKFVEMTRTLVINRHGARILLKRFLTPGTTVKISNLAARREADFRVVGPTEPATDEGAEWGVEIGEEHKNIWGIEFPPPSKDESISTGLLECLRCGAVALLPISLMEYDVLTSSGLLAKQCSACGQATTWKHSEQGQGTMTLRDGGPEGCPDRREAKRVALRLPVRVRGYYQEMEYTRSENVSKAGFCFTSVNDYEVGEGLLVTCPYDPRGQNIEVRARIVSREGMSGTGRKIYGVRYDQQHSVH